MQKDIKQVIDTLLKEMLDPKNFTFLSFYVVVYGVGTSLLIDFIFAAPNLKVFVPIINTIFTLIGFAIPVLFLLRKPRKKTKKSNSVKEKSKSILNIKPPIFLSESMAVLYKNTKDVGEKIVSLRMKIRKTEEYIAMLDEHKQDSLAADMAQRQKEYYRYFVKYYDSYCSLYLDMRFQFYMEQIKNISKSKKKIHKLNIKQFTDTIREDIRSTLCILKNDALFDRYFANTAVLPYRSNPLDFIVYDYVLAIETGEAKDGRSGRSITLRKTARQIETINGKILQVTAYLIALQSDALIGGVSPIAEENIFNMHKQENDFEEIIAYSEKLTDEYDRFAAEISLMKDLGK